MQAREEVPKGFPFAGLLVDDDRSECLCVSHCVSLCGHSIDSLYWEPLIMYTIRWIKIPYISRA